MAFLELCSGDPLLDTLYAIFNANIVKIPEERIKPVCVIARGKSKSYFRGDLASILVGNPELKYTVQESRMADVSGKRSRSVNTKLGLDILSGFLQGFSIPSAGICAQFKKALSVSFKFMNVRRYFVEPNYLGMILWQKYFNRKSPAASIFFGKKKYDAMLIDSVITSSDFSINVERTSSKNFKLDIPAIQTIAAKVNTQIDVSTSSGYDLIFKGDKNLTFAFTCLNLQLNDKGKIIALPSVDKITPMFKMMTTTTISKAKVAPSPAKVLLSSKPAMISWD